MILFLLFCIGLGLTIGIAIGKTDLNRQIHIM